MFMYVFSIVLIVGSSLIYNIAQKANSEKAHPFLALQVTYLTAITLTSLVLLFYRPDKELLPALRELNWSNVLLGVAIIGLEVGYLLAFRAGWNISAGSLVANTILALLLVPLGIFSYKESFGLNQMLGVALCIGGLILINLK